MALIKANLLIDQGTDFTASIDIVDDNNDVVDLTGYTGRAQLRKNYVSSTYYSFSVGISNTQGIVTLSMSSNTTANIEAGRYVYDCLLTDSNGATTRLLEGVVTISAGVTK